MRLYSTLLLSLMILQHMVGAAVSYPSSYGKTLEKRKYGGRSYSSYSYNSGGSGRLGANNEKDDKLKGCNMTLPTPERTTMGCNKHTGCRVECEDGYSFPNKRLTLIFECQDGQWLENNNGYTKVPECTKEDSEEYDSEESACEMYVPTPHSRVNCPSEELCELECHAGYKLPKNKKMLELFCEGGQWKPIEDPYKDVPLCELNTPPEPACAMYVPTPHSRVNCPSDESCELRCHAGYKLPENKKMLELVCDGGQWKPYEIQYKDVPLCEPNTPPEPECGDHPVPPQATIHCETERICQVNCAEGYKFPSGQSSVQVSCIAGVWQIEAEEEDKSRGCVREMLTCSGETPRKLENATIECDDIRCAATCVTGHKFPNGKSEITMECTKGAWRMPGTNWESLPDCVLELKSTTKCNGSKYLVFPNIGAYKVNATQVTWADAQKTCIHEGAHLAVIDSKEELELMKKLIAPFHTKNSWTYAHIGFSDLAKKSVFVTVLGNILDSVHFAKWAPRNPSKLNERCGAIDHKGRLHDIFCTSEQIFICEKV